MKDDIQTKIEDRINKLETLGRERAKVEALLEQAMGQLDGMGLKTLADAEAELENIIKARTEAINNATKLVEEFDEKYAQFF